MTRAIETEDPGACSSLGYAGNGIYKCGCGEVITDSQSVLDASSPGVLALKDQWVAHKKEKVVVR